MSLQWKMDSKVGPLYLVAGADGLAGVHWSRQEAPLLTRLRSADEAALAHLRQAVAELEEYFAGERWEFSLKLDPRGTEFQRLVWRELAKIPYGRTLSYSELARKIRKPLAVRAVGTANGRNPLSILIPCHRVIAADGSLGGYAGGLERKRILLGLEGVSPRGGEGSSRFSSGAER
jgi:methylated-DNA-[protein]-cysteine S-methyltransferase